MVTTVTQPFALQPNDCRKALGEFWSGQLTVERDKNGLVLALPLMLPDGVQVTLEIHPISDVRAVMTDAGDVLQWLAGHGVKPESDRNSELISERLKAFELSRDGFEIYREIPLPVQGVDVHLFGEALVSISHLFYRHETQQPVVPTADGQIVRLLKDVKAPYRRNVALPGYIEESIKVDYYVERTRPSAIEVIKKGGRILDTMECWGYRWNDLKRKNGDLRSAMIYDPDRQIIDSTSRRIGEECCNLFCAYHETDRILDFVNS